MNRRMPERNARARRHLHALVRDLAVLDERGCSSMTAGQVARALSDAFGTVSSVHRAELSKDGYHLGLCEGAGWPAPVDLKAELGAHYRRHGERAGAYDPLRPAVEQRNVVLGERELAPTRSAATRGLCQRLGVAHFPQMRVLVCDGSMLLAWVGTTREEDFSDEEHRLLHGLVPSLRARLGMHRMLEAGAVQGLDAAVDEIDAPAFMMTAKRVVAHTNAAGAALLRTRRAETLARIDQAIDRPERGSGDVGRQVRACGSGAPFWLVVLRASRARGLVELEDASRRWSLTRRERDVLALVARGHANKDVATKLGCAVATVEIHVSAILRKAGVDSRAQVVARFWTGE